MVRTVELENIGPIASLSIPLPDGGGLVCLRGRNGKGKSIALEAVDALVRGQGKPTCRDGAQKGIVEGLGAKVTVGKVVRRTGGEELEVHSLESKFDVSQIVDPGIANPEAADDKRIKALIQLSGVPLDLSKFYDLVGSETLFNQLTPIADPSKEDWLSAAGKIKRNLEAQARKKEEEAKTARAKADGLSHSWQSVDTTVETDAATLQTALEDAIRQESKVKADFETENNALVAAEKARMAMRAAQDEYSGPTLAEAEEREAQAKQDVEDCRKEVARLQAALDQAQAKEEAARKAARVASERTMMVRTHFSAMEKWEKQVAAAASVTPTDPEDLAKAAMCVQEARLAIEAGAMARKAKADMELAKGLREDARKHAEDAEWLRERAKATDDVLSGVVGLFCDRVKVVAGRLVTQTSRGQTYFADLSDGERWTIALEIAVGAVGPNGLLVIPQVAYEGLDPINRRHIDAELRRLGATGITAEASEDDEIRVECAV